MKSLRKRAALALLTVVVLIAAACSSSGSDLVDSDTAPPAVDAGTDAGADSGTTSEAPEADAVPDAGSDPAESAASDPATDVTDTEIEPPDLAANAVQMARALFNVDPDPAAAACIVAEGEKMPGLGEALAAGSLLFSDFGDDQLKDVTYGVNGCVNSLALGGWATDAVGPNGDVRDAAPACFAERFDDPDNGDGVFHTFIALSFQYRYDPEFVDSTQDALVTCTPISGLSELFANSAEAEANFAITIDRDCFAEALGDPAVSEAFWGRLIDGIQPPITALEGSIDTCSVASEAAEPESGVSEIPADFVPWSGTRGLAAVQPAARANAYSAAPPMAIDPTASYEAVFNTGGGEIRIRLMPEHAPVTVNNFVSLARDGYYDGTVFHRVLEGFMAQGGDPTDTGTGGSGYSFGDEFDGGPSLDKPGLLAMANSGPATNGSQFFITFVPTEWLTGAHTVFGEVIAGQDIVDAIERRDPGGPTRGQILESVDIIES